MMRLRAYLWMLAAAIVLLTTAARLYPSPPLETNLLALLPVTERNLSAEQAVARLGRLTGERAVFLVGARSRNEARAAAGRLAAGLQDSGVFKQVVTRVPTPEPAALLDLYQPYRSGLAAPERRDGAPDQATLAARLQARLANPFGNGVLSIADDPFGDFDAWLQSLPYRQLRLMPEDGWLTLHADHRTWVLVSGELAGSAFEPTLQQQLKAGLDPVEEQLHRLWPDLKVLRAGAVFHATAARERAEHEVRVIGFGSLTGIVLLLWLAYRSPLPLMLGLASAGVGICAALLVSTAVFGRLHLITLVFGASLVGEAIDYAIQYFSARLGAGPQWDAGRGLATVLPALSIALVTSIVGYAALALTPFPAMRQIALFAVTGLTTAWATVLLLLPWALARPQARIPDRLLALPGRWLQFWRCRVSSRSYIAVAALALLLAAPGWLRLQADDDIRQLIQAPPGLTAQEQELKSLTGMQAGSQFFLIEGADAEQVLQREEALASRCAAGGLQLQSVASFVPSCRLQQAVRDQRLAGWEAQRESLRQAGFREEVIADWKTHLSDSFECLTPERWLAAPLSLPFRHLWMTGPEQPPAGLALPAGYQQLSELSDAAAGLAGVTLVDKPGAVSRLFGVYRHMASWVLAGASLFILAVLAWRYGLRGAMAILLPILLAQALVLGGLGWSGTALNLFNVLALLLILGVGINYAIFLVEGDQGGTRHQAASQLGVLLSATTTLLSFGLLSLSSTPVLSGFGTTLATGIGLAVLLAPGILSLGVKPRHR